MLFAEHEIWYSMAMILALQYTVNWNFPPKIPWVYPLILCLVLLKRSGGNIKHELRWKIRSMADIAEISRRQISPMHIHRLHPHIAINCHRSVWWTLSMSGWNLKSWHYGKLYHLAIKFHSWNRQYCIARMLYRTPSSGCCCFFLFNFNS